MTDTNGTPRGDSAKALDVAAETVERQQENFSKQPRFASDPSSFYLSTLKWMKLPFMSRPDYSADSRQYDRWLREFWPQEPHLSGVINSVISIDKNRGWSLTGGRNQVIRYTNVLHDAENGQGWRRYISLQSNSFYTANLGAVTETGRDGTGGPLRALYHVDPTNCRLNGGDETPLFYYPPNGRRQPWTREDYFRTSSLPSTDETFNGLGYCALARCAELAQVMIAVMQHDQEELGARAPRGLLLLQNITQQQWEDAMGAREARLTAKERTYFGGVEVLAQMGIDQIDAKLIALSNLPKNFDMKIWTDLLMYGYALCFGYDPSEFWPVQFGSLGRGTETAVQHMKATGKGGLDFILSFQENLQERLPETLHFEFDQRDDEGEMLDAQVRLAKADVVTKMYESGLQLGAPLLTREEARSLLAESDLIPREWTEIEEESQATDTEQERVKRLRRRALEDHRTREAIQRYQHEPIIRYEWRLGRAKEIVLWDRGYEALRRSAWAVHRATLFEEGDVEITDEDVDEAIAEAATDEFKEFLENKPLTDEELDRIGG